MPLVNAQDGQFAYAPGIPAGQNTRRLWSHHYYFDIPDQATINTITLSVVRRGITPGTVADQEILLMLNETTAVGSNEARLASWPTTGFGPETYTWTQPSVTVAQLESVDFGAAVRAHNNSGALAAARVDFMGLTVEYTCP